MQSFRHSLFVDHLTNGYFNLKIAAAEIKSRGLDSCLSSELLGANLFLFAEGRGLKFIVVAF